MKTRNIFWIGSAVCSAIGNLFHLPLLGELAVALGVYLICCGLAKEKL